MTTRTIPRLRIGLIGGCLAAQAGIPMSRLYHRALARRLAEEAGLPIEFVFAHHATWDYVDRFRELLAKGPLDGMILQIRPIFLIKKAQLFTVYRPRSRRLKKLFFHPFLVRRSEYGWQQCYARLPLAEGTRRGHPDRWENAKPVGKDLGLRLGKLFGLDDWAIRDELWMIDRLIAQAREHALPLFMFGPTPYAMAPGRSALYRRLARELQPVLDSTAIPYCDFAEVEPPQARSLLYADGMHLNLAGHDYVAGAIYQKILPWLKEIELAKPGRSGAGPLPSVLPADGSPQSPGQSGQAPAIID